MLILESWITKANADEPQDTLTPPSESYDREEVVVLIGQAAQDNITHLLPIHRLGNSKFWNLGDAEDMPADSFEGRFAGLLPPKPSDDQTRQMGKKLLDAMGVKVSMLKYLRMTKTQINQHIAGFEKLVNRHANKISEIGNASRDPIKSTLAAAFSGSL